MKQNILKCLKFIAKQAENITQIQTAELEILTNKANANIQFMFD